MKALVLMLLLILESLLAVVEGVVGIFSGLLAVFRVWSMRDYSYLNWLKRDLSDCGSILELGCGSNSPLLKIGLGKRTTAVDIWQPYIDAHNRSQDYLCCKQADVLTMPFAGKSYDAVVICDVMEHLPRAEVLRIDLFAKMEQCARKKVIIFAPNGYIDNDEVDGDPYQAHVSSWEPSDYLERGYLVKGATGIRWILGKASLPKYHPYSVFAIIAMLSQIFIYNRPKWAWHSYAVKSL